MQCGKNRDSSSLNLSFPAVCWIEESTQRIEALGGGSSKLLFLLSSIPFSFLTVPFQGLQTCVHVPSLWNHHPSHKRRIFFFGSFSYLVNSQKLDTKGVSLLRYFGSRREWDKVKSYLLTKAPIPIFPLVRAATDFLPNLLKEQQKLTSFLQVHQQG